jgi:tetratricopeptide (TPR) repeat protein
MRPVWMLMVMLAFAACALGQQAAQPPAPASGSPPAAPAGKQPPKAKSQEELTAYTAAGSITDPAALEKAAADFAVKFPDSELSPVLYRTVIRTYQAANNNDKVLEMGEQILKGDPDDSEALVDVAQVLTERTRDSDADKDQRLARAMQYAQHALETVDHDVPPGLTKAQEDIFKALTRSNAYSVIGTLQFNAGKFPEAEGSFRKSIDAFAAQPDPVVMLRLAMALDKEGKYPEALKEADQAVALTQDGAPVGVLARREHDRLAKLTGGGSPPADPAKK